MGLKLLRKKLSVITVSVYLGVIALIPSTARADLFGSDTAVLVKILANSLKQLAELRQILGNSRDSLYLLREVNRGLKDGIRVIQILNPKFNPGLYGDLETADQVLRAIQDLYGAIPRTSEAVLHEMQDRSVAESISMNGTLFRFADTADEESRRIIAHAQNVNPQGAAKLTAQSIAVLIGVTTQVLRTNSMMLKMMGENMALQNRKGKIEAAQFKTQYEGISGAMRDLPANTSLSPLTRSK